MFKLRNSYLALILTVAAAACGGGDASDEIIDDMGPDIIPDETDETAPTILATSPQTGAIGQSADTAVSITFSEPMDKASVEGTLDHSDLGDVDIVWNAAGDTITIIPQSALEYAEGLGADPDVVDALAYSVVLGNAAMDLAGNALGSGTQIKFETLKSMGLVLKVDNDLTRSLKATAELVGANDDPLSVGDTSTDEGVRTLVSFDLSIVPESAVGIESADFLTRQQLGDTSGYPYGYEPDEDPGLGDTMLIDHVSYSELNTAAFNSHQSAHAELGEFCVEGQVVIEIDVTDAVSDDLDNRGSRDDLSQYLLRFELDNDQDAKQDRAVISRGLTELSLFYLAP